MTSTYTSGPSANHRSINFNFQVNNENYTTPLDSSSGNGKDPQHLDKLVKQNAFLKDIISQIAPSIIPQGARRKRSATSVLPPRGRPEGLRPIRRPGGRYNGTKVVCARPSRRCYPRGPNQITTTKRPILPLPLLRAKHKPSDCVLNYFEKALRIFQGDQPSPNNWKFGGLSLKGKIH